MNDNSQYTGEKTDHSSSDQAIQIVVEIIVEVIINLESSIY